MTVHNTPRMVYQALIRRLNRRAIKRQQLQRVRYHAWLTRQKRLKRLYPEAYAESVEFNRQHDLGPQNKPLLKLEPGYHKRSMRKVTMPKLSFMESKDD